MPDVGREPVHDEVRSRSIRFLPRAPLVAATTGLIVFGGQTAASADPPGDGVSDPVPIEFDCFGAYYPTLPGVIFAEPYPAITWGSGGNDVIIGTEFEDRIYGLGGDDRICALGGGDYVEGGLLTSGGTYDDDQIDGGSGSDVLHGGQGDDHIYGGTNFSPADSFQYHDFLYGDDDDTLYGQSGPDVLHGGNVVDHCDGGTGMAGNRPEADTATPHCNTIVNVP